MKNGKSKPDRKQSANRAEVDGDRPAAFDSEPGMVDPRDLTATNPVPPRVVKPALAEDAKDKENSG